jgi:hypothetical protein
VSLWVLRIKSTPTPPTPPRLNFETSKPGPEKHGYTITPLQKGSTGTLQYLDHYIFWIFGMNIHSIILSISNVNFQKLLTLKPSTKNPISFFKKRQNPQLYVQFQKSGVLPPVSALKRGVSPQIFQADWCHQVNVHLINARKQTVPILFISTSCLVLYLTPLSRF